MQAIARGTSTLPKHLLSFPSESDFVIQKLVFQTCADKLNEALGALDLRWQYRPALSTGVGFAKGNVWSRAARRRQWQHDSPLSKMAEDHDMNDDGGNSDFVFKVQLQKGGEGGIKVKIRWLQGRDSVLFESFCGMLKRQLSAG